MGVRDGARTRACTFTHGCMHMEYISEHVPVCVYSLNM